MKLRQSGFSIVELLIVVAVIGVLAGVGFGLLPRQNMAVNQGQRIFASAVQFARFEAIKRNALVEAVYEVGADAVVVRTSDIGTQIRRFTLNPQSSSVVIKETGARNAIEFNARGVSTAPVTRSVTIGIVGREDFDRALSISGQGAVGRQE